MYLQWSYTKKFYLCLRNESLLLSEKEMKECSLHTLLTAVLLLFVPYMFGKSVQGIVLDEDGNPLSGANVYWSGTTSGTGTDADGRFTLDLEKGTKQLVTSYLGYHNDTTEVMSSSPLTIVLVSDLFLDEVSITERRMSVLRSRSSAIATETLTGEELVKAACCNLSESFETSASVDVSYSDAATGAKQIRLLGLSGSYIQLLTENTPSIRGLSQSFGLEYIPGSWMESIQISKGTSSVVNGYEAIAGQINVELLKPQKQDPIAINLYLNSELMAELNATGGWKLNDKASTGVLLNARDMELVMDKNKDGFTDIPRNRHLNLLNRWFIQSGSYTGQVLLRGLYDQRQGGQLMSSSDNPYLIDLRTRRLEGFMKNGYVFDKALNRSIGIITAASYHSQSNGYGNRHWDASQANAYLNAIFQTSFDDSKRDTADVHEHKLTAGVSLNYDRYNEQYEGIFSSCYSAGDNPLDEVTPGVFAEYTYTYKDRLTLLLGLREDYSNRYGFFTTPRMNIRYSPTDWVTLRGSVGLGYRSPHIVADYASYLPSNRGYIVSDRLSQEKTLNAGITTMFYIPIGSREVSLSAEYYYIRFFSGVIADLDASPHSVQIINISGTAGAESYSHSCQIEASMEILRGWTATLAFRYMDVKQTTSALIGGGVVLRDKVLQNKFKGLVTMSYQTPLKTWQFDITAQFNGHGRMPMGFQIPDESKQYYRVGDEIYHKWYPQLLGQVTKYWRTCSLYIGGENMTNYTQDSPIVNAQDPTQDTFDASMVWAPISGWKIYLGFRWNLEKQDD